MDVRVLGGTVRRYVWFAPFFSKVKLSPSGFFASDSNGRPSVSDRPTTDLTPEVYSYSLVLGIKILQVFVVNGHDNFLHVLENARTRVTAIVYIPSRYAKINRCKIFTQMRLDSY